MLYKVEKPRLSGPNVRMNSANAKAAGASKSHVRIEDRFLQARIVPNRPPPMPKMTINARYPAMTMG